MVTFPGEKLPWASNRDTTTEYLVCSSAIKIDHFKPPAAFYEILNNLWQMTELIDHESSGSEENPRARDAWLREWWPLPAFCVSAPAFGNSNANATLAGFHLVRVARPLGKRIVIWRPAGRRRSRRS
jgi:hypothetical protein